MSRDPQRVARGNFRDLFHMVKRRRASAKAVTSEPAYAYYTHRTEEEDRFFELCFRNLLLIDSIRLQHSLRWLRVQLDVLLTSALAAQTDPERAIEEFIDRQSRTVKPATLFFPVSGIELRVDGLPFGGALFKRFNASEIEALVPVILGRSLTADERTMIRELNSLAVLEVRAAADHQKAIELGTIRVERIVNVLTFLASLEFGDQAGIEVTTVRADPPATPPILVLSGSTWETIQTTRGPYPFRLIVNVGLERLLRKHSIDGLVEVLALVNEEKDDINRTLLDAIHWFAVAIQEQRPEIKMLNYTTAGELFFSASRKNVLSNFADGAAYLLAGEDSSARSSIKKQIEGLYDVRSLISHGGRHDQYDDAIAAIRRLVREIILKMLVRRAEIS